MVDRISNLHAVFSFTCSDVQSLNGDKKESDLAGLLLLLLAWDPPPSLGPAVALTPPLLNGLSPPTTSWEVLRLILNLTQIGQSYWTIIIQLILRQRWTTYFWHLHVFAPVKRGDSTCTTHFVDSIYYQDNDTNWIIQTITHIPVYLPGEKSFEASFLFLFPDYLFVISEYSIGVVFTRRRQ